MCSYAKLGCWFLSEPPGHLILSSPAKTAKGKSLLFEVIVVFGYTVGLLGKLITWNRTGVWAYSIWFYIADIVMVLTDMGLYFRNTALDHKVERNG